MSKTQSTTMELYRGAARALAVFSAIASAIIVAGYLFRVEALASPFPGFLRVKANTALSLLLVAIGILSLEARRATVRKFVAGGCAFLVCVLTGSVLLEYLFSWTSTLDTAIFSDFSREMAGSEPGRMALTTAISLILLAFALMLRDISRLSAVVDGVLLAAMLIAGYGLLVGELNGVPRVDPLQPIRISQTTALLVLLQASALFLLRPAAGIMQIIVSRTAAGTALRVLLPAAFLIPAFATWLNIKGVETGLYSDVYGDSIVSVLASSLLLSLVIGGSFWLFRSGESSRRRERLFSSLIEHSSDGMVLLDGNGVIQFVSTSAERLLGHPPSDVVGHSMFELVHPDDVESFRNEFLRLHAEPSAIATATARFRHHDGCWRWIEGSARNCLSEPAVGAMVGNFRDITERRDADERYREMIEHSVEGVFQTTPDGRFISANAALARIYGASSIDELVVSIDDIREQIFVDSDRRTEFLRRIEREGMVKGFEYEARRLDGTRTWVLENARAVRDKSGTTLYYEGEVQDIGDRKRAELELARSNAALTALFDTSPAAIFAIDINRQVTSWNPAAERVFGWSAEEVIGHPNPTVPPESSQESRGLFDEVMNGRTIEQTEMIRMKKTGERIVVSLSCAPLRDGTGEISGLMAIVEDVTRRHQGENQLRQSLREKEVLLREIHHRVKNNMQVISSMLSLQSSSVVDTRDRAVFLESQNRVRSMALVHELLYRSRDLAQVDLAAYTRELVQTLTGTYAIDSSRISISLELESVSLDIDNAIPIGLCINELITNAMKHAFPGDRIGVIIVQVNVLPNGHYSVSVADNGKGMDPGVDLRQSTTLGLQLVSTLTDQIGASLTIDSGEGTTISIMGRG